MLGWHNKYRAVVTLDASHPTEERTRTVEFGDEGTQIAQIVDRNYTGENVPVSENVGLLYYITSTFKHIYEELKINCMHYRSKLACVMLRTFLFLKFKSMCGCMFVF